MPFATGTYGVFILHHGAWILNSTFSKKGDALRELAYVQNMLGLTARMFVKQ